MSVNMFRLRLRIDANARSKIGQPAHNTTGEASTHSIHLLTGHIMNASRGAVSTAAIQNRRVMSSSSGFLSSSETVIGSKAMPQIGHGPGLFVMISGCIGQVYFAAL